jgi:hypothetical protein
VTPALEPEDGETPQRLLARVAGCGAPFLIGVRHHSPACAAALPALLDAFAPERVLLELPADLQPWIEWLGHPELEAPVALASVDGSGVGLSFYPFADFSPELAALRWASAKGVPVEAFDEPIAARRTHGPRREDDSGPDSPRLLDAFCRAGEASDVEAAWDRLVEARAPGATAEEVRRAALLFGLALRLDSARGPGVDPVDLGREAHMRARVAFHGGGRVAAVVGAFHTPALLPEPLLWAPPTEDLVEQQRPARRERKEAGVVSSLVPYSFDLLDSRSGYPAGIRDPVWQQRVLEALRAGDSTAGLVKEVAVEICRELRKQGHVAGVPDANELVRLALDLARLRALPGPGRRELLEAMTSALGQGELMGRGRALARALEHVLVGTRRGRLPASAPRSGLGPHVSELMAALRLPDLSTPTREPQDLRLDPLRSDLDRRRHVALERLCACGIPYGTREAVAGIGDTEAVGVAWRLRVTASTEAMVEMAAIFGVTLAQAAEGSWRRARARLEADERLTARTSLELLERAAECGLPAVVRAGLLELTGPLLRQAGLSDLVAGAALIERIARGHVPGLPREKPERDGPGQVEAFEIPAGVDGAALIAAAVRTLEGLAGSELLEDVKGVLELVRWFERQPEGAFVLGGGQLGTAIDRLAREGSPLMQGAATAAKVLLGRQMSEAAGEAMGSWVDAAAELEGRRALAGRLKGMLVVAGPRLEVDAGLLEGLVARVEALSEVGFLERVAALRDGFEVLSPAARQRLLDALAERHGLDRASQRTFDAPLERSPQELARMASADQRARAWLDRLGLGPRTRGPLEERPSADRFGSSPRTRGPLEERPSADRFGSSPRTRGPLEERPSADRFGSSELLKNAGDGEGGVCVQGPSQPRRLAALDRWRLILGREREKLPVALRSAARALDELYGAGHGEGSRVNLSGGGGTEEPFPSVREWASELEALFGGRVREEVLGRAASRGRAAAVTALDPDAVVPSVELLEEVLSLKGALPESQLGTLRRLVARIVSDLIRELAVRLEPALAGLSVPRPTRRRGGPLDLRRTIARNLRTARRDTQGRLTIVPELPLFRSRSRRSLDWRVILVVDVSGSMEASVIYSAMMAAILSGLPAVSVDFLAFSTEVIDLSHRVDDPLGLLLEVAVGGGTHIAKALRAARQKVRVPARTLLVTVSDFEEGFSVDALVAEVRALCESGVKALGLAALDDGGKPRYDVAIAEQLAGAGMPIAALTPLELARWIGEQIR